MTYPYPTLTERIPLQDALWRIADKLGLSAEALQGYAAEDTLGGYHHDPEQKTFERGIWGVEGQVVYALIRALKPKHVLEVGNCWGCSTEHIGDAILANGAGKFTSLDILEHDGVPPQYAAFMKTVTADLREFNYRTRPLIDFVFEDSVHNPDLTAHVWGQFNTYAKKGAVIVSHDSEHFKIGVDVREGIERVTDDYLSVAIDPADCGLAVWRKA